tara:strand:- start:1484 stop:1780 length:297 start_codon:yes stop_codon:yes gene_type:complete
MKTKDLSTQATTVYNVMLDLNWGEPYITMQYLKAATGLSRSKLEPTLAELIGASKVLHGNEEALGELIETFTPMVKGVAYGYPLDFFKGYNEWMKNKL